MAIWQWGCDGRQHPSAVLCRPSASSNTVIALIACSNSNTLAACSLNYKAQRQYKFAMALGSQSLLRMFSCCISFGYGSYA